MSNAIDLKSRYRSAAIKKYEYSDDFEIEDDADVSLGANTNGAWVTGRIWIWEDELEPVPGPTINVWCCAPNFEGTAFEPWFIEATFTCDDDPDGEQARFAAHLHARSMRRMHPTYLLAVRPAGSWPLTPRFNG